MEVGRLTVREILESAFAETDTTQTEAARKIGMSCKQLSDRITRDTLKASSFLDMLDAMGIDVQFKVRETGLDMRPKRRGMAGHISHMIRGVTYDTSKSYLLFGEMPSPGNFTELYQTKDRQYFVVDKSLYGGNDMTLVIPLTTNGAIDFLKEHNADESLIAFIVKGKVS